MKAVVFDNELKLVNDYKKPVPQAGEALVRVTLAGICNTDYEITKGYMGYVGVLGHEAVGVVEEVNAEDQSLVGKRVVPEISYGCKDPDCSWCAENALVPLRQDDYHAKAEYLKKSIEKGHVSNEIIETLADIWGDR